MCTLRVCWGRLNMTERFVRAIWSITTQTRCYWTLDLLWRGQHILMIGSLVLPLCEPNYSSIVFFGGYNIIWLEIEINIFGWCCLAWANFDVTPHLENISFNDVSEILSCEWSIFWTTTWFLNKTWQDHRRVKIKEGEGIPTSYPLYNIGQ